MPALKIRHGGARQNAWMAALLCLLLLAPLGLSKAAQNRATEEARLKKLRLHIETLEEKLNETRGRRDNVREEVRALERRIGGLVHDLRQTQRQLSADEKKLSTLNARAAVENGRLNEQRRQLARQIYAAYLMGQEEYPKLLLNQQNPASVSRVLTYYEYLNTARTQRIGQIQITLRQLNSLEQQIQAHRQELQGLRAHQHDQKAALESAGVRRGELLASLNREVRDQSQQIDHLRADEQRLERLVEDLKAVLPETPFPTGANVHFARLRGHLPLPVRGRIIARYGTHKNVGNLKWRGLLLSSHEGQDVSAVFRGRVVFADWLRGFGLLLILDHGDGYMTLYGHNQSLHKEVGDWVEAGEVIASVGNTGDIAQPGLYFEVRHNGEPRDPLIWCKAR